MQEALQRVGWARQAVVTGIDVIAGSNGHHSGADLGRDQRSAEWKETVGLDLGDRPQIESLRSTNLKDGLHNDHPRMMRQNRSARTQIPEPLTYRPVPPLTRIFSVVPVGGSADSLHGGHAGISGRGQPLGGRRRRRTGE
ncbi:hypothetical protein [Streptomyces sp. NBC_01762]|uniref:hypothetical protein n=1 Tax=Streptomyces sp. NBC_01762 TaxID=2975933 RepID=UPI002DDBA0F9|nr:hypothetical protein [Streptomyces sp. NBC_01762]